MTSSEDSKRKREDTADVRKEARDKTVMSFAKRPASWLETDVSEAITEETGKASEEAAGTVAAETAEAHSAKDEQTSQQPEAGPSQEPPWPEEHTPPEDTATAPETSADEPADDFGIEASGPEPEDADGTSALVSSQEASPAEAAAESADNAEAPPAPDSATGSPSPDLQDATAMPSAEPAGEDDDFAPLPEARIEVPVQQQYASLLAALHQRIEKHPGGHDLLSVLRMLEGQTAPGIAAPGTRVGKTDEPAPPRIGKSRRTMEDIARFGQDPSSEFATSTIERAKRDADGGLVLLERFLGLLGPQGSLPSALTDEAIVYGLTGDDAFPRFLDIFNNRFIQLFYRAWADARPIVQHDRPDDDRFLTYLGSSIGVGSGIYRDLDRIDDRLKLLYAGLSSAKTKSAARLKALITGVFGVRVEIDQCVGTWLHLDPDDQLSLSSHGRGGAGQLGRDTIVGAKVYSVSDKIRIRIFTKSLEEYRKFLPPTRTKPNLWTEKLFDLIDFYLGLEVEYEIELALPKRCASSVQMNRSNSATLGHIGWLKPSAAAGGADDTAETEDEEMLTDTRFRPVRRHTTVYQ